MVERIGISAADRTRLEAVVAAPRSPQKHVWRARIILLSADGVGTIEIARRAGIAKSTVWRWQRRFAEAGVDGLLREKSRPPGIAPLPGETVARVVALTGEPPPGGATHWTVRAMAKAVGISHASVQRIWQAHGLQPHRLKTFKLSKDPAFAAKLREIVGLYVDPPAHAVVLSGDEKSQIQALDRTQPGLPIKPGRLGTMTHDYKRHGTTKRLAIPGHPAHAARQSTARKMQNKIVSLTSPLLDSSPSSGRSRRRGQFHREMDVRPVI